MSKKTKMTIAAGAIIAVAGIVIYNNFGARSASWSFLQTDWSGGASTTAVAVHPGDAEGWDYFYSADSVIATATPGQISLSSTTADWTETDTADFAAGTLSSTAATSGKVVLLKPAGVACQFGAECLGSYCDSDGYCSVCEDFTYEEQAYGTVIIGEQCWMAENLNVGLRVDTCDNGPCVGAACQQDCATRGGAVNNQGTDCMSIEKYCYNDATSTYCDVEGGLYQWDQAMCGSETAGAQGICPSGWHIPADNEWYELENYLKDAGETCDAERNGTYDCATAGTKLKSGGTSGFDALLAGGRGSSGNFYSRGSDAYFWSSSVSGSNAWERGLGSSESRVGRGAANQAYGLSVRCAKD